MTIDAELYLRLEGERSLLGAPGELPTLAAVAAGLTAVGRISMEDAVEIVNDYGRAGSAYAHNVHPGAFVQPATNSSDWTGISKMEVVAANAVVDTGWGRVLYPYVSVTDHRVRALMIVEGQSKVPPGLHPNQMRIVDDRGHSYPVHLDGGGTAPGSDTFSAFVTAPGPIPESVRWLEINQVRIDLRAEDRRRPSVEIEDRQDSSAGERYLEAFLSWNGGAFEPRLGAAVTRALVECGELDTGHPLVQEVLAEGDDADSGRPVATRFPLLTGPPAQTAFAPASGRTADVHAVALGAILPGVDGVTLGLDALVTGPHGFQIGTLVGTPLSPHAVGWPAPQQLIRWEAEDDLGHSYTACLSNERQTDPSGPGDAQLQFSPALDPGARLLRITATGVRQVARITVTIRGSEW